MKKTFKVVLMPTEKAQLDQLIYRQVKSVFGETIDKPVLEFTTNETYIRNSVLMNSGNAVTNSQSRDQYFELLVISNDDLKEGDWYYCSDRNHVNKCFEYQACPFDKKIIASTDKAMTPNSWIPESFINDYVEAFNEGREITEVDLEIGKASKFSSDESVLEFSVNEKLNTSPDKSVIIYQIKMYSRDQVANFLEQWNLEFTENSEVYKMGLHKWIEDNL